jgi:GMP synthase-like glutamine amidotransferase
LIAAALADDSPQLCVCLGAQLLAVVAGGQVRPLAGGAEIGVTPLWLSDAAFGDPLFGGIEPPLEAAQWHELEVAELPPGARLLSRGETCRNQAFRVGRSAWGLQFHLEVLPDGFARWARDGTDDLDRAGLRSADVIDDVRTAESSLRALWAPVIDQWVSVCIERRDVFSA